MKSSVASAVRWLTSQQGISFVTESIAVNVWQSTKSACASSSSRLFFLLGADEGPDFVALDLFALKAVHHAVLIERTGLTHVGEQLQDRVLALARHPRRAVDSHAFHEAAQDGNAVFDGELVHRRLSFGSVELKFVT